VTLHTDLYYQSEAWTRVFNMPGYDKLKAYSNINLAAIFTNEDAGWKVMAYVKNVLDRDSITGAFLNSDDTGLTTNVFLTEPRLYGLRVTKDFTGGGWWKGANAHAGPYPLTVELSGQVQRQDAPYASIAPDFVAAFSEAVDPTTVQHRDLDWGDGRQIRLIYRPDGAWSVSAGVRYGRANAKVPQVHLSEAVNPVCAWLPDGPQGAYCASEPLLIRASINWSDTTAQEREEHLVADFTIGRDFGLGLIGDSHSKVSAGLRYAQFESTTATTMDGIPDWNFPEGWIKYPTTFHHYRASAVADRKFDGLGPELSWEAAQRLWGSEEAGHLDLDWAVTAGVLFGKQDMIVTGTEESSYFNGKYLVLVDPGVLPPLTSMPLNVAPRSKDVTVPVVDLSLGLAYEVGRVKVGAGYKWERYFNVLDGGYAEHKDEDRTIDGPYFKIAVGFGG
jgi:hypothetical protein